MGVIKARVVAMLAIGLLMAGTASVARAADPDPDAWHVSDHALRLGPGNLRRRDGARGQLGG